MPATPAPLTRRLLAALESHAREDAGPLALSDWAALSALFDRELALLARLAAAVDEEGAATDVELRTRATALQARYRHRGERLASGARHLHNERQALNAARRCSREVGQAYAAG